MLDVLRELDVANKYLNIVFEEEVYFLYYLFSRIKIETH